MHRPKSNVQRPRSTVQDRRSDLAEGPCSASHEHGREQVAPMFCHGRKRLKVQRRRLRPLAGLGTGAARPSQLLACLGARLLGHAGRPHRNRRVGLGRDPARTARRARRRSRTRGRPGGARDSPATTSTRAVFLVERWTGSPANTAPEEHDRIAWFGEKEIDGLVLADPDLLGIIVRELRAGDTGLQDEHRGRQRAPPLLSRVRVLLGRPRARNGAG